MQAIPHFGYCDEVVMDGVIAARAAVRPLAASRGLPLSFLPFLVKAASLALLDFPALNATLSPDGSEVTRRGAHNIGVAMDTPRGLIVPVLAAVQDRSLFDIAAELKRLQALAADGKLGGGDLADGTFTLSNIGAVGGTYASPILVAPQVSN